jgi:hypothetical protein
VRRDDEATTARLRFGINGAIHSDPPLLCLC